MSNEHASKGNELPNELVELDETTMDQVGGGEVGQFAQAIRNWEFGSNAPRMAVSWSCMMAYKLY